MTSRAHIRECPHCQDCQRRSDWDFLGNFFTREERLVGYTRGLEYQVRNLHLALARGAQDVQAARFACKDLVRQLGETRSAYDAAQAELTLKDDRLNDFELDLQDRRRQLVEYQVECTKNREMIRKMGQILSNVIHGDGEDVLDTLGQYEEVLDTLAANDQEQASENGDPSSRTVENGTADFPAA